MTRLANDEAGEAMPQFHEKGIGCALLERQAWRELQQERAEPTSKPAHLRKEAVQCGVSLLQTALVRDRLRDLHGEAEVPRHRCGPAFVGRPLVRAVERGVDLDGVEQA